MDREVKKISDSMIEHIYQVRPEHLNAAGRLFGGKDRKSTRLNSSH